MSDRSHRSDSEGRGEDEDVWTDVSSRQSTTSDRSESESEGEGGGEGDSESEGENEDGQALFMWYNVLTQHLMRRTSARPGLPHEMVREIKKFSQLTVPMAEVISKNRIIADASDQQPIRRLWFESKPFTSQHAIDSLAAAKLFTYGQHQGWVSLPDQGSWSWFELAILVEAGRDVPSKAGDGGDNYSNSGVERVKIGGDGRPLRWISHKIPVPQRKATHLEGSLFDGDHELFSNIEIGDSIGVFACAQYGGWQCKGFEGKLVFEAFFEPLPLIHA